MFEENHAQCLWQNGCHGREWGLGSAEWIKNLEPSLCTTLGVEPVLGGAPARFVLTASESEALRVYPSWLWVMGFTGEMS